MICSFCAGQFVLDSSFRRHFEHFPLKTTLHEFSLYCIQRPWIYQNVLSFLPGSLSLLTEAKFDESSLLPGCILRLERAAFPRWTTYIHFLTTHLKGQCHEIFASGFFHESVSLQPLNIPLRPFQTPRMYEKIQNGPNGIIRALGETDS